MIERFEALLASGKDGTLLRFSLGNEYLKAGDAIKAAMHLRAAVAADPGYSAAWKLLGKSLEAQGEVDEAIATYTKGIAAAESRGDKQVIREMGVFLKRLEKTRGGEPGA